MRSEVQVFPGPPVFDRASEGRRANAARELRLGKPASRSDLSFIAAEQGAIAQLGERLLCKQEVVGSIPSGSTSGNARPVSELVRENESAHAMRRVHAPCMRVLSDIVKRRSFRANV